MEIVSLPVSSWKEYRHLRLRALKENPEAFSSGYEVARDLPDDHWKHRLEEAQQGKRGWLLFARDDAKLVGMIGAYVPEGVSDRATIVSVYVPKEERGKDISSRLMTAMLERLSQTGRFRSARLSVHVGQRPAIRLYEKFGFREVGREPGTTGAGQAVEQIVMERDLGPRSD